MEELFNRCEICPRRCLANRNNNEKGYCKASNIMKIGGYRLHKWEEPVISGKNGSGTIFFSYCNLRCVFCQNYDISIDCFGDEISIERFSDICLELEKMGAENINLVTPTHYIPLIRRGIILAKEKGLKLPIVYNSSGYESVDSLRLLEGLVDIYLPDFKYYDNDMGKFSNVNDYFDVASLALDEMYRQVGKCVCEDDVLKSGIIVRHLVLPGHIDDSKKVIEYLYKKYGDDVILSIMNQYTPVKKVMYDELNFRLSNIDYDELINYAYDLGVRNAFVQDEESQSDSFIPNFRGDSLI
ncbi:MAG: radical SAM protein [Bacilli bacterium]|nr:radical SAM protein [Bacilli bacterium]